MTQEEAEAYLARLIEEAKKEILFGVKRKTALAFVEAAVMYRSEITHLSSRTDVEARIGWWVDKIGNVPLEDIRNNTLKPYTCELLAAGKSPKTVNEYIAVVSTILRRAAGRWENENGEPYLDAAPNIEKLPRDPARLLKLGLPLPKEPYPLSWDEQAALFAELPEYLATMALFKVNTGLRQQEVCQLAWRWEKEWGFSIPKGLHTKMRRGRPVVLNRIARNIVESQRGLHPTWVFTHNGKAIRKMHVTAWKRAWVRAGLPVSNEWTRGVHLLRNTFASRLRDAGVDEWTVRDLLGHQGRDVTRLYSVPTIRVLQEAVEKICERQDHVILRAVR